jgi:AcrR family transcriptional regulator
VLLTPIYFDVIVDDMKLKKRRYVMTARTAKAEATKARIRVSAMELYCERPVEDFTLEEVAERAGVAVRTILRAYATKDELVYAALEEMAASDLVIQRLSDERRRPGLKPSLDQGRENHRDGVKTIFAPQLEQRHGAARAQLLNILIVMTDVYVWKLLRRDIGLSRSAAEATVCKMIAGVTEEEKAHGADSLAELVGRRQPAS